MIDRVVTVMVLVIHLGSLSAGVKLNRAVRAETIHEQDKGKELFGTTRPCCSLAYIYTPRQCHNADASLRPVLAESLPYSPIILISNSAHMSS